eukprot:Gb_06621 [translate_table: standard]
MAVYSSAIMCLRLAPSSSIPGRVSNAKTGQNLAFVGNISLKKVLKDCGRIICSVGSSALDSTSKVAVPEYRSALWKDELIDNVDSSAFCDDEHVESLINEIKGKLQSMNDGEINASAYDTAWVGRVRAIDGSARPQFPETIEWILKNQLADGSWGEDSIFLAYDRILNTLSCIITLAIWKTGNTHVQKGVEFIRRHAELMTNEADNHRLSGLEIVFPSMLKEAKLLNLNLPYELPVMNQIDKKREAKLKKIPTDDLHNIQTGLLYSLEGLQDVIEWNRIMHLQCEDGSFLSSPASTACAFMHTGDKKCLEYLTFILTRFGDHVPCIYPIDIFERLWAVDTIERLGIDHHFQQEIEAILDYVYRNWRETGIGWTRKISYADIDDTIMGLRMLRLHGYDVSSDVLKNFKEENEEFFCLPGQAQRGVSDMLNLYRCSQIACPGEKIMKEANAFTKNHLRNALEQNNLYDKWAIKKNLRGEVEYALKYPWHMSLPRLEARTYVEQYGSNDIWLGKAVYKWWKESGFTQLNFTRQRWVETYFSAVACMFEAQFSACRIAYAKALSLVVIVDDLYDVRGSTLDDLMIFSEAVKRWDQSLLEILPSDMQICFRGLYNTVNELAEVGREWEKQITSFTKEAEWREAKYVPLMNKYLDNSKDERDHGELASSVQCYLKENPGCTEKESLHHIYDIIEKL